MSFCNQIFKLLFNDEQYWSVDYYNIKFQKKPLMIWIWISVATLSLGGFLSLIRQNIIKFITVFILVFILTIFYLSLNK